MSRFRCPRCGAMNVTTGFPNEIEGWFISDVNASNVQDVEDLETWLEQSAQRAHRCEQCGAVSLAEPEPPDAR